MFRGMSGQGTAAGAMIGNNNNNQTSASHQSTMNNTTSSLVSPSPTRTAIKEANDHLQLLHQRVQELERTVREQAEALIKKDECMQTRIRELTNAKDTQIADLSRALEQSGEHIQRLEQATRDREAQLEEANRRNSEELGSYIPVLERLVMSLRKTATPSSSSSSGRGSSWSTNHLVNEDQQHFNLPGSRVASPSVSKQSTMVNSTYHRARKLFKGAGTSNNLVAQGLRFHSNALDSGGDRPTSPSSAGHVVPPEMRIGRSFNINSNFSMSDDDDDRDVENQSHNFS